MAAQESDVFAIIQAIRKAWYEGRRIVPIVGAGLSVDSGIPTIQSLIRYFCKFHQHLQMEAFLPPGWQRSTWLGHSIEALRSQPWRYVEKFEWPDRFELTQGLQHRLEENDPSVSDSGHRLMEEAIRKSLGEILTRINPEGRERFRSVSDALVRMKGFEDLMEQEFRLLGDWKRVVQHFTNHQGDYADALFQRLTRRRGPGVGHRFLAFLVKLLAIRQVFTFNFDDLIERSLSAEGIDHQVFPMEQGSELPFEGLVRDLTAVIKMHGGNRSLLLDERLDHPLGAEYKRRFQAMTGSKALLLVIGCSGGDRRLRDLLEWSVGEPGSRTTVAWLHFERDTPRHVQRLREAAGRNGADPRRVLSAATASPGLTLQHLFSALSGRHPAATRPYAALVTRPLPLGWSPSEGDAHFGRTAETLASRRIVLSTLSADLTPDHHLDSTASEALLDWAAYWTRGGYHTVWVDLEAAHTLAAVVGTIIDQCRQIDPGLSPGVLPLDDAHEAVIAIGVRRVADALRRSRYVVLFDGIEAYVWPPTVHHGESPSIEPDDGRRVDRLKGFLIALGDQPLGGSKLMVGVDGSKLRSESRGTRPEMMEKYRALERELRGRDWTLVPLRRTAVRYDEMFDLGEPRPYADLSEAVRTEVRKELGPNGTQPPWIMVLQALSTVRRARHLAFSRQLLRPLVGDGESFERLLAVLTRQTATGPSAPAMGKRTGLARLEGGGIWFQRAVRDAVYEFNSRLTARDRMAALLEGKAPDPGDFADTAAQAFMLAAVHQWVARVYYSHTFVQAHDAVAFMEYMYHRLSSIKYLTKLLALTHRAARAGGPALRRAVVEGFGRFAAVVRGSVPRERREDLVAELVSDESLARHLRGKPARSIPFAVLDAAVGKRHRRDLRHLTRAWSRAEPQLRSQVPAAQLLSWTDVLIRDDLPNRLHSVVIGYDAGKAVLYTGGPFLPEAVAAVRGLRQALADTRVKLHLERSDYDRVALERYECFPVADPRPGPRRVSARDFRPIARSLVRRVRAYAAGRPLPDDDPHPPALCVVHYLLDATVALIKRGQESPGSSPEGSSRERRALGELLGDITEFLTTIQEKVRGTAEDRGSPRGKPARGRRGPVRRGWREYVADLADAEDRTGAEGDYNEAWLRVHHLRAELDLGDVCVFASARGFEKALKAANRRLRPAVTDIRQGLYKIRGQAQRSDGRFRSLILEPSVDGSIYLPYRSAFHILDARAKWLSAARRLGPNRLRHDAANAFESAFYSLDLSRGGLTPGNRLVAALTELYAVETSLACARLLLRADPAPAAGEAGRAIEAAYAKYETVRLCLQRARDHLLSGRRNVIWWKLFYLLVAQYHGDRLSLGLLRVMRGTDDEASAKRFSHPEFVTRLRRGHQAVRSALDYQLPDADSTTCWPWLRRVWAEMSVTAAVVALMPIPTPDPEGATLELTRDEVRAIIRHVNVTTRLIPTAPGQVAEPQVDEMRKWIEDDSATGLMSEAASLIEKTRGRDALRIRIEVLDASHRWLQRKDDAGK